MGKIITKKKALDIIGNFERSKVLVVGDIMVDQFIWGKVSRISPEAPVPVVRVTAESLLLGGCANVLNTIFAMGGQIALSGVVGADSMGVWLNRELTQMDVDTKGIVVEPERATTVKTRVIAHNQQVVRFDRENQEPIHSSSTRKILQYVESRKQEIQAIVISDYNKGVVSQELVRGIRTIISGRNIAMCIDPKQNGFGMYRGCSLITPNHYEAGRALGLEIESDAEIREAGERLLAEFDFQSVLITRGERGMTLFEKSGSVTCIPAAAKEVFDVTGAGDTVIGTFALCVAAGATFREAASLANHAAGIVVGKVGTATVSQEELRNIL